MKDYLLNGLLIIFILIIAIKIYMDSDSFNLSYQGFDAAENQQSWSGFTFESGIQSGTTVKILIVATAAGLESQSVVLSTSTPGGTDYQY